MICGGWEYNGKHKECDKMKTKSKITTALSICLMLLLVAVGCSKDVEYTKGFPFWKYDWKQGELMATYKGIGGGYEWKYLRYLSIPDTVLNLNTNEKYAAPFQTLERKFITDKFSGIVYDYSTIKVNDDILYFPGVEKEWSN